MKKTNNCFCVARNLNTLYKLIKVDVINNLLPLHLLSSIDNN